MNPFSASYIYDINDITYPIPSSSRPDEHSQFISQYDIFRVFDQWDFLGRRTTWLEDEQSFTDRIRALCTSKQQELARDWGCQSLPRSLLADMELILRDWEERLAKERGKKWEKEWEKWREEAQEKGRRYRWTLEHVLEYQAWLCLEEKLILKLNRLVDGYEREKTVEENRKRYEEKKKIESSHWAARASCKQLIGGLTSCDRRFSHDIPPDLPSTLFESDFCSSTVAVLRTALLRLYKGYRLLNLQAA